MGNINLPVKVLNVIEDLDVGGTEISLFRITSSFDKNIISSIVCTFRDGPVSGYLRKANIPVHVIPKKRPWDLKLLIKLITFVIKNEIQIIHCRGGRPTVYGGAAAFFTRTPLVISVHGEKALQYPREVQCLKFFVQNCKPCIIISVSNHLKSEIYRRTALNKTIHVINNGVDLSESVNRSSEQLSELLINKNGYLWVGAIGSLRPVKGYDLLIKAIPNIVTEFPYARFMIVGDGPSRSYLETLATKIDVANYVTFLGRQKNDSSIISKFDIVVVPSRSEGISNVILEAMRAAKPVVATNVGGNSEVILAHKTGILVPPESPEAIAKAVCELLGDANKRKLLGMCARKHVQQRFNLQRTVQEYQKVYLKLLQNRI